MVCGLALAQNAKAQLPANPWAVVSEPRAEASAASSSQEKTAAADVGHIKTSYGTAMEVESASQTSGTNTASFATPRVTAKTIGGHRAIKNASTKGYAMPRRSSSGGKFALPRRSSANAANTASRVYNAAGLNNGMVNNWRGSGKYDQQAYTGAVTTYDKAYGQEMLAPEVNNNNMNVMVQQLRNLGYKIPASYDNGFANFLSDYTDGLRTAYSGLGRQNNPADTVFNGILDSFEHFTGLDVGNLMFNSIDLIKRD